MPKVNLGDRAKDVITGLEGIVVAITNWLHGCKRFTLQPETLKDGKPLDNWTIDEAQVELVAPAVHKPWTAPTAPAAAQTYSPAGPRPDPTREPNPTR